MRGEGWVQGVGKAGVRGKGASHTGTLPSDTHLGLRDLHVLPYKVRGVGGPNNAHSVSSYAQFGILELPHKPVVAAPVVVQATLHMKMAHAPTGSSNRITIPTSWAWVEFHLLRLYTVEGDHACNHLANSIHTP